MSKAIMQCQSYFPTYNSRYDLNINVNGGVRPIYNGNGIFPGGHYYDAVPSLPRDCIRQTLIMHEVTFRHQVQELHRLYRRQKELMSEIKNNHLYMDHLHIELQGSGCVAEKFGQNATVSGNGAHLECKLVQELTCRKIGRMFLDLELPAEAYIDTGEREIDPSVLNKVALGIDAMALSVNKWSDLIPKGESPSSSSFARAKTKLADLNEPLIPERVDSGPEVSYRNHVLFEKGNAELESSSNESNTEANPSRQVMNGLNHLDLNSTVVEIPDFTSSDTSTSKVFEEADIKGKDDVSPRMSKKRWLIDINLPCDPTIDEDQGIIEDDVGLEHDRKDPNQKSSFLDHTSLEIDLEAPPSPELEECSPPRGDSETHSDASIDELHKIAADAIVSMSTFKCQPSSSTETLEWFAGLVHSLSSESDTPTIDEFEAMTLSLTEMKADEYWSQNKLQIESFSESLPSSNSTETRKGRARRSKRKDFQRDVLPSISSLFRYEVTEDIQMIEGLMEAAGTPWHLNGSRRACRMGRKPRAAKPEGCSFDKPVLESRAGTFVGWGKDNRRPRGKRSPASTSGVVSK